MEILYNFACIEDAWKLMSLENLCRLHLPGFRGAFHCAKLETEKLNLNYYGRKKKYESILIDD